MAPGYLSTRVVRLMSDPSTASDDPPITPAVLRTLTVPAVVDAAAATLAADSVDAACYASTTSAYVIGFDAEQRMISRLRNRLAVPVVATCASAVTALHTLDVRRVALVGAPWFDPELNALGATYFESRRFDVVFSESAQLSQDPAAIEADAVYEWTSRHIPDEAEAIFIGGNGFRAAAAIERLETALGRPVLTSNQVLLWNLLDQTRASCELNGYGRLLRQSRSP
jgi:maleate isomerase